MTRSRSLLKFAPVLLLIVTFHNRSIHPLAQTQSGPSYSLTVLSEFFSPAHDINDSGVVVGYADLGCGHGPSCGYVWTAYSGMQRMVTTSPEVDMFPAFGSGVTVSTNSSGIVAGTGAPNGIGVQPGLPALYSAPSGIQFLIPPDYVAGSATGINDSGTVVGNVSPPGSGVQPFVYTPSGGVSIIPGFHPLSGNGYAYDVNNVGQVVGNCTGDVAIGSTPEDVAHCVTSASGNSTGFAWSQAGGFSLVPKFGIDEVAVAMAINGSGEVAGRSTDGQTGSHRVFKWSSSSGLVDLQAPTGYPELVNMNDAGQILATISSGTLGQVPYLYQDGVWHNLNDLIPSDGEFILYGARRINNSGQIVGYGGITAGQGYVLTPTQEPSNHPPVLTAIGGKSINEQSTLSFTATASDPDPTDSSTFSLDSGSPAGASITIAGVFSWTPTEAQGPGSYPVTIRVTDSGNPAQSDSETITITVNEVNSAPVLALIGNKAIKQGSVLTFTASATDPDVPNNTPSFSLDAGAPAGATIQSATGVFSWTPSNGKQSLGDYPVTIRVTDNGSPTQSDFEVVTITVTKKGGKP